MLFEKVEKTDNTKELTKDLASEIYLKLKTKSPNELFEDVSTNYDWQNIKKTYTEAIETEKIIYNIMNYTEKDLETGEIIISTPETKEELISRFDKEYSLEYLDSVTLINDIVGDWETFKSSFKED